MPTLQHQVTIHAPVEKVWSTLADLETVQLYNPTVAEARYVSTVREGVGATRECRFKKKGFVRERIVAYDPMKSITMEVCGGDFPVAFMHWRTEVAPINGHTLVTQRLEYAPKHGVFGKLLDALFMRRMIDGVLIKLFASLKAFVEGSGVSRR